MINFVKAREEIALLLQSSIDDNANNFLALLGYIPVLYVGRVVTGDKIDKGKHFFRLNVNSVGSDQRGICGETGALRYENFGVVIIQLFAPTANIESAEQQDRIAAFFQSTLRKRFATGKVWFKNVSVKDLNSEGEMLRLNVTAEYEHHDVE